MSKAPSDGTNIARTTYQKKELMEQISIRYGEPVTLPIDAGDPLATSADIYIGKPGEAYTLTAHTELTLGVGVFELAPDQTKIPIGTYYYQINVNDDSGYPTKYPSPDEECSGCEVDFPEFIVGEALDEIEVS